MSYLLGNILDDWRALQAAGSGQPLPGIPSEEMACLNKANASPQVVGMDMIVTSLVKNWNPTGYYQPADVRKILDTLADEAAAAGAALAAAPSSTGDALEIKAQAFQTMLRAYQDRSVGYEKAFADAKSSGASVIDAPALKDWVISSMRSISDAYVTAAVLQCRQSWLESILDTGYKGMAKIGAVAAAILGVTYKLGMSAVKAIDNAAGIAAFIITYAPYAAAGLGAYMLYQLLKKRL